MNELTIAPNRPLTVALVDPEGRFDFETGMGQYQTTTGELVTLPRPAVVILNTLDPQPGEEIVITKHWSGKPAEKAEWTISLSSRAENARAKAEGEPSDLTEQLQASIRAGSSPERGCSSSYAHPQASQAATGPGNSAPLVRIAGMRQLELLTIPAPTMCEYVRSRLCGFTDRQHARDASRAQKRQKSKRMAALPPRRAQQEIFINMGQPTLFDMEPTEESTK
jgi:hypothetical protein